MALTEVTLRYIVGDETVMEQVITSPSSDVFSKDFVTAVQQQIQKRFVQLSPTFRFLT
jgi:hypothetical protein